ncbi:hypothetical protein SAMN02787073_2707 [Chryseobacterium vrystaatense]|uniref:Uncharacterized protein n=1 Tax=Chryseobacterium vrystaatense TaxID=307480 RepID=A0A1M5DTD3_9FLAO|nr:hypothetical protein SAMN02787073_2707 [Chryseobacterium vrystaatense]
MKVTVYIIYIIIFTFCYYYLNRKLGNKGIFILYPMLFVAVVFALKFWFQYAKLQYGDNMAGSWLKIGLMTLGCFCLFTIVYKVFCISFLYRRDHIAGNSYFQIVKMIYKIR